MPSIHLLQRVGRFTRVSVRSILVAVAVSSPITAIQAADPEEVLAGHSGHGEVFNEGPRQAAYIMPGLSKIDFPATTENEVVQRFINQGVAQLHGFWYYEAERSFRQAAVLDPDCAITYWGMAMANQGNRDRGKDFIAEAVERLDGVTKREKLYIKALEQYFADKDGKKDISKKDRAKRYTTDLEEIVEEFPDDIEAKAFLGVQLWQNARADLPIVSHVAINSLLQDIFDANPNHPAHHYRIHLWDRHKPKRALESAAMCGPSSPSIAHMWHMPGHIYDKLHRYHDAAWQQEASARVDHAHMMRDRVMPDQIHNFAHNNEWLIRNLVKIGRVYEALDLAKNMLELPRHPAYNSVKRGSAKYGRERLLLVLTKYRLWDELVTFANTDYLEPTDEPKLRIGRLSALGSALALSAQADTAEEILDDLDYQLSTAKAEVKELEALVKKAKEKKPADKADDDESEAKTDNLKAAANRKRKEKENEEKLKPLKSERDALEKAVKSVEASVLAAKGDWDKALDLWKKSDLKDDLLKAEWMVAAGKVDEAVKLVEKEIKDHPGEILPLAVAAFIEFEQGNQDKAKEHFNALRPLACNADIQTPLLSRLTPIATAMELPDDWRGERESKDDLGERPELDSLGPFRWSPYMAPDFKVVRSDGESLRMKQLKGKPTVVIFYLGFGCLHCIEQLHEFSPEAERFRSQGIDVIAISTEDRDSLNEALADYSNPLDIPLHANPDLHAFKAFRCYDDFEKQPLHGTYLLDPNGRVLWQDISYEPFMDVEFLLSESKRLLHLGGFELPDAAPEPKVESATTE